MKKMPKKILVYVCDFEKNGTPILAVATKLNEIHSDYVGNLVGEYGLNYQAQLEVTRELVPCGKK